MKTDFSLRAAVRALRSWMTEQDLRCVKHQGVPVVKVQLVFLSDTDAHDARRRFMDSVEGQDLQSEILLNGYAGQGGAFMIEGIPVQFVGPEIRVSR